LSIAEVVGKRDMRRKKAVFFTKSHGKGGEKRWLFGKNKRDSPLQSPERCGIMNPR
jgi:hypothetical protein